MGAGQMDSPVGTGSLWGTGRAGLSADSTQQDLHSMPSRQSMDWMAHVQPGAAVGKTRLSRPSPPAALDSKSLVAAVSSEVVRKLRLASEAELKDDRETVLEEVFCDCTGLLDEQAQAQLGAMGPVPFYAVLAKHYASARGADTAVAVLHMLQGLYGQGYAAPLAALLLHRWLLLRRCGSLPEEQRTRLAHVVALGSAQLFLGDVHRGAKAFYLLWHVLCHEVVLGEAEPRGWGVPSPIAESHASNAANVSGVQPPGAASSSTATAAAPELEPGRGAGIKNGPAAVGLACLPLPARTGLLAAVAAFLLYYAPMEQLQELLRLFPSPSCPPAPSLPTQHVPAASHVSDRQPPLMSSEWQGVDFIMLEVVDLLGRVRSEAGLCYYLEGVRRLQGQPVLQQPHGMRTTTRLRLQGVLYALSSPGGPHYPPRAVRAAALDALDALFPAGRTTRACVRAVFRLLHPTDWLGELLSAPLAFFQRILMQLALAAFMLLHSLVVWGRWGGSSSSSSSSSLAPTPAAPSTPSPANKHSNSARGSPNRHPKQQGSGSSSTGRGRGMTPIEHDTTSASKAAVQQLQHGHERTGPWYGWLLRSRQHNQHHVTASQENDVVPMHPMPGST